MVARALTALVPFAIVALAATPVTAQPSTEPVATNLAFTTNMAFALDGRIFFTEKETGDVRIIRDGRVLPEPFVHISVEGSSERGLLGIALDPNFERQPWVYLYYSEAGGASNRIIRVRAEGDSAGEIDPLITLLPAVAGYHNGGDMAFGPDGKLYAVTGEAHDPERAQDPNDLGGKVLRLDPDGSVPDDNPLGPSNPVYALGIRNSFGLCLDPVRGNLWETENGPATDGEVNRIVAGANYGWPDQLGPGGEPGFVDPILVFPEEIVPTGCAISAHGRRLYFGSYRGGLYEADLSSDGTSLDAPGRIPGIDDSVIDVARGPDGTIYLATTNSILRLAGTPTGSPVPVGSPTSPGLGGGARTGVGLVIAAVLIGGLILLRRRIDRRPR
jgi:glucose/arabinose dehydrogenase